MKKIVAILMAMIMVISVTVVLAGSAADNDTKPKEPVIIGFESTPSQADKAMVRGHGGDIKYSYTIINAIAAKLPEPAIENIQKNPRVTYVEMDVEVHTLEDTLPWGVDRIDAELVWNGAEGGCDVIVGRNAGNGVNVAIIDTGIDDDHPDLSVVGGRNYVVGSPFDDKFNDNWDDDNGHGTHCAGIVAALDNEMGVIGVAPEASLYAVKVLGSNGRGWTSDVIAGIQWSSENGMQVISMSLGSSSGSTSLYDACNAAADAGIVVVAAAGNSGPGDNTVNYPAKYGSVIAVSATDNTDTIASSSSRGAEVELAAPGVHIYSTYRGGGYATMSGTSMACPHVAGTAALAIVAGGSDVRQRLKGTADDLGVSGKDNLYGYGLVDADEAAPSTNEPPVADANGLYFGDEGSSIEFDGSGSYDPDGGTIVSYEWDFGDGTTGTGSNPTHAYADNGEYTVTLIVRDDDGGIGTGTTTATISNVAPTADAGGPYTGYVGQAVTFAGSATDPGTADVLTYEWDFDYVGTAFTIDASGEDLTNPSYTYVSEGSYTIALCVSDADGGVSTIPIASVTITAPDKEAPVITDAIGDRTGTTGEPVRVSATITDNVGVVSATVHYTPIGTTEETTVAMTKEATSDVWSVDVPVDSDKVGTITYYITAQDAAPKTARDPTTGTYSITVADNDDPGSIPDLSATAVAGGNVELAWSSATDNIGVVSYNIYRESPEITDVTGLTPIATTSGTTYPDTTGIEGTTYYYAVTAVDAVGNEADASNSPSATPDATAPAISAVGSSDVTGTSATIIWATAEASDSVVNYGTTTPLESTESNLAMVTSHSVTLTGLAPKTTYYYDLQSTDAAGNTATDNNDEAYHTFTTIAPTNTLHVASIVMSTTKYRDKGWFTYANATVKIVDADGDPVKDANVSGTWSGLTEDSDSGLTDSNGEIALGSDSVKNARGTFTFMVTGVEHPELTYDPNANEEASASITV